MDNKRSYLDTLNAGRQRRSHASLEELSRTLESLESRFARVQQAASRGPAMPPAATAAHFESAPARPVAAPRASTIYEPEPRPAEIGGISSELRALRAELRQQMGSGLKREFQALREDLGRNDGAADLTKEMERLSRAVQTLGEHSDDRSMQLLRSELEDMKRALAQLAREDSVRSVDRRWDDFDRRWSAFEERVAGAGQQKDLGVESLTKRLEQISEAVNGLPESLALKSMDEKVRTLASVIERLARSQEQVATDTFSTLHERLDEITRAIAAAPIRPEAPGIDPDSLQRIEARLALLGRQFEDMAMSRDSVDLSDRLTVLSEQIEDLASRADGPERAIEALNRNTAQISARLDELPKLFDEDRLVDRLDGRLSSMSRQIDELPSSFNETRILAGVDERLSLFSDALADRLKEADEVGQAENQSVLTAIEARIAALAVRMETAAPAGFDEGAMELLENRLDEIAKKIERAGAGGQRGDAEAIQALESQIAALTDHLTARDGPATGDSSLLTTRIAGVEQALSGNRDAVIEAARLAAEGAMLSFQGSRDDRDSIEALASDLKSLENLSRRSDDRNARTFEAIHDTLLKIVDRLATMENGRRDAPLEVSNPPSLDPGFYPEPGNMGPTSLEKVVASPRTPAEAAAAAAFAALNDERDGSAEPSQRKKSLLGGIASVLSGGRGRKEPAAASPARKEAEPTLETRLDEPLDPQAANRPLEPGSGAPDLNAILKRVRTERGDQGQPASKDAAKADFIAAARRAAQAAAAEADVLKQGSDTKPMKAGFKFGGLGKSRRKPLLMAVGAIMIAIAALQLGKAFFTAPAELASVEPAAIVAEEIGEDEDLLVIDEADASEDAAPSEASTAAIPEARTAVTSATAVEAEGQVASAPATSQVPVEAPAEPARVSVPLADIPVEAGPIALREAAAAGDAKALFEIGARYDEARGVEADKGAAAKWYEKSAEMGFAPAQYRIGSFSEKGVGVERDVVKAKTWYQLAAAQGNASAMHNLAVLFAMGPEGTPDSQSAARWFLEAAELGVKDSQFNMGILSAKGAGVPQSLEESYKWFALVAKQGDKDAAQKRDEVANAMRPEQLEKARAAVELWKPKLLAPEANVVEIPDSWTESEGETASIDMTKAVRNIQLILDKNGYDVGAPDGIMGAKTKTAIAAFQKANGLPATGEVDEALVRELLARK